MRRKQFSLVPLLLSLVVVLSCGTGYASATASKLSLGLGASAATGAAGALAESASDTFTDVTGANPYYTQITKLVALGVVSGYGDGTFGPDQPLTRQQFAKMIVRTLDLPVSLQDVSPFTDVAAGLDPGDPLYPDHYVAVCAARRITDGVTPTTFAPWANVTRAQLITMVARAADPPAPPPGYSPPFGNLSSVHYPWARKAAYAGILDGLQGIGSGYDFWRPATRGEACAVLFQLLGEPTRLQSGDVITGKVFIGGDPFGGPTAIYGSGVDGATLHNLTFETSQNGLRLGTGAQSSNIEADGLIFRHLALPVFLANVSNSTFDNLDIQADKFDTNKWHGMYLERDNHNLTFNNLKISGGSGYCLQLHMTEGYGGPSDYITFNNVTLDATTGRYPLIIDSYKHVRFNNLTIIAPAASTMDWPAIMFYGGVDDVVFNGFNVVGGNALVGWNYGEPTNVVFKNGTYTGPSLTWSEIGDQSKDFTFENVVLKHADGG